MWAVVPIKQFSIAKMRLAAVLNDAERIALARAMFRDVLSALRDCPGVGEIVVVSKESEARPIAAEFGARYLVEDGNDLSLAVTQGGRHVAAAGESVMLTLPGDVPLVSAAEIGRLIDVQADRRGITLVSDRERAGTNGLAVSPIDLMPFSYGMDSFQAHAETARELGESVKTVELEGLSLDIDTPDDIRVLMDYDRQTATLDYLHEIDVVSRLPPRHNVGQAVLG